MMWTKITTSLLALHADKLETSQLEIYIFQFLATLSKTLPQNSKLLVSKLAITMPSFTTAISSFLTLVSLLYSSSADKLETFQLEI